MDPEHQHDFSLYDGERMVMVCACGAYLEWGHICEPDPLPDADAREER